VVEERERRRGRDKRERGGASDRPPTKKQHTHPTPTQPQDEPTNFLDRDSLAALVAGLDAFAGGVVCISHCKEFTDAVCDETWDVGNHRVSITRRPGAAQPDKEKTTVSVFLPRNASGKDLALEGDALDAAILEAARLKEEKRLAAKEKKAAKDLEKKLRASRRY